MCFDLIGGATVLLQLHSRGLGDNVEKPWHLVIYTLCRRIVLFLIKLLRILTDLNGNCRQY